MPRVLAELVHWRLRERALASLSRTFKDPRTFNLHRSNVRKHLTFGHGIHFCAGAEMARVEGRVAFETLLSRLDDIRLAPDEDLSHHASFSARGYKHVNIEFKPVA